jgi:hypothetical protein
VVVLYPLDSDRLKSAVAHMQGELGGFDAPRGALREKLRSEVQPGGWRCNCSPLAREHRLIALGVQPIFFVALDVRRQRCAADAVDDLVKVAFGFEAYDAPARVAPLENFGSQLASRKLDSRAGKQCSPRPNQRFPYKRFDSADQKDFDTTAKDGRASRGHSQSPTNQPRGKHSSVVKHEQVAIAKMLGQLREDRVRKLARHPIDYE